MDTQTLLKPFTFSKKNRNLMSATTDMVGEKVREARNGFTTALHGGEKVFGLVKEKAVENVIGTDATLRKHPYETIAITLGIGALVGYSLHRYIQTHRTGIKASLVFPS